MSQRPDKEQRTPLRLDPETRRAMLVDAATEVFLGRDPNEVTFEEVAEAGGVSRSLLYAYFGDRGGLIAAVYLRNLERLDDELGVALDEGLPDDERLRRIIGRYLEFARDNEPAWNVMAAAGALQHPAIQSARRERVERVAAAWPGGPRARLVARAVVGLLEAGAQDWIEHRDADLEEATEVLFAVLWDGLAGLRDRGIVVTG